LDGRVIQDSLSILSAHLLRRRINYSLNITPLFLTHSENTRFGCIIDYKDIYLRLFAHQQWLNIQLLNFLALLVDHKLGELNNGG
jgi:hypothetical protein